MKEIGGYIELDTCHRPLLHEGAIALNCGRNALVYLLKARHIKKLWLPRLLCNSVSNVCEREGVAVSWYPIGADFLPAKEVALDVARREQVDGVIAYSSDPAAPTAAYVAEKLGLPTNLTRR